MRHKHYDVQLSYPSQTAGIRMCNKDVLDNFIFSQAGPLAIPGPRAWSDWPVAQSTRVCEPFLEGSRVDILCTQLYDICFIRVLDGDRGVTVGCYNGPRYRKGWKPLEANTCSVLAFLEHKLSQIYNCKRNSCWEKWFITWFILPKRIFKK